MISPHVGGTRIVGNVRNILPCPCGGMPQVSQVGREQYSQSKISCPLCGFTVENNIPLNQLVDIYNAQVRAKIKSEEG